LAPAPAPAKPLGTGQHTIPIYLDAKGRMRYAKLKGTEAAEAPLRVEEASAP
jgi:hypothetical protein